MRSASSALVALDAGPVGSFFAVVDNVLETLGGDDAVESVFEVGKVELLVHLFL